MLPARLLVVTVPLFVACTSAPNESTAISARVIGNRLTSSTLVANKSSATKLLSQKLAACQTESNVFSVNLDAAGDLLATSDGREVFSAIAACALSSGVTLEVTVADGSFEFVGDLGLAPDWLSGPLGVDGQRWVSACLFSRVNALDSFIPISARGPHPALAADGDERLAFTLQEGGFFGNYFTPKAAPIAWYACRGAAKAHGNDGDLAHRNCAAPDPKNPGFTMCGFSYAGDCGAFSAVHACEQFATGGTFYQRCHPARSDKAPAGVPVDAFLQVITTYVLP
jgi:hypothetical protein